MSRNLATKPRILRSECQKGRKSISCDGCSRAIEHPADLITIVHQLVFVGGFCSQCHARMMIEYQRRAPHAAGSRRRRFCSQSTTPLSLLAKAIGHTRTHRSTTFPGEPIVQINTARMTWLISFFGVLVLAFTVISILSPNVSWGLLFIMWSIVILPLELRLSSYFRYERHVKGSSAIEEIL